MTQNYRELAQGQPKPILSVARLLQSAGEQRTDLDLRGRAAGGGEKGVPAGSDLDVGWQ